MMVSYSLYKRFCKKSKHHLHSEESGMEEPKELTQNGKNIQSWNYSVGLSPTGNLWPTK